MKNKIIYNHPTIGYITFNDLINDIETIANEYKNLEEIVIDILKLNNYDEEIISSLFTIDIYNDLKNIAHILKDKL